MSSHSTLGPFQSSYGDNNKPKCFNHQGFGHQAKNRPSPKMNVPIKPMSAVDNEDVVETKEFKQTKLVVQAINPLYRSN